MKAHMLKRRTLRCITTVALAAGLMLPATATMAYGANATGEASETGSSPATEEIAPNAAGVAEALTAGIATAAAEPRAAWTGTYDLEVVGGTEGVDYEFTTVSYSRRAHTGTATLSDLASIPMLVVKTDTPLTVANKSGVAHATTGIRIEKGVDAHLTFDGVKISAPVPCDIVTNSKNPRTTDKTLAGAATKLHLTLADGSENELLAVAQYHAPGLRCGEGSELYIDDAVANVDASGAAITPVNGLIPEGTVYTDKAGNRRTAAAKDGSNSMSNLESDDPGSLLAQGGYRVAGIGSGSVENAGLMVFNGGDITAKAWALNGDPLLNDAAQINWDYSDGAGIGSAYAGHGTQMVFNGGTVDAYGSYHGSAIGAGIWSHSPNTSTGDGKNNWAYRTYPFDDAIYSGLTVGGQSGTAATQTLCGDITINGGFLKAKGGLHGNAFGQGCGGTAKGCTILITGGTLLPASESGMYDIGGTGGDVIITGGSVNCTKDAAGKYKFNGNAGVGLAYGNPEKTFKVALTTTNVKSKIDSLAVANDPSLLGTTDPGKAFYNSRIESWELLINKFKEIPVAQPDGTTYKYVYGSPSRLDNCLLYLWLPEGINKDNRIDVNFGYKVGDDVVTSNTTQPPTGDSGEVSQPRETEVFKLPEAFTSNLSKYYDGENLPDVGVKKNDPSTHIAVDNPKGGALTDPNLITYDAQRYDYQGGSSIESAVGAKSMPSDSGIFYVEIISTEYANTDGFKETYWAHAATGWATISPVNSKTELVPTEPVKLTIDGEERAFSGPEWVQDDKDSEDYNTATNNHLVVPVDITSWTLPNGDVVDGSNMSKKTCKAPMGRLQLYLDDEPVGAAFGGVIDFDRDAVDAGTAQNVKVVVDGEGREHTIAYFNLTRSQLEGFGLQDKSEADNKHEVSVSFTTVDPDYEPPAPAAVPQLASEEGSGAIALTRAALAATREAAALPDSAYRNYYDSRSDAVEVTIQLTEPDFRLYNENGTGYIPNGEGLADSEKEANDKLLKLDADHSKASYEVQVADFRDGASRAAVPDWFPAFVQTNSIGDIEFASSNTGVVSMVPNAFTTNRTYEPNKTDYGVGAKARVVSAGKTTITATIKGTGAYSSLTRSFDLYVFPDLDTEPELAISEISRDTTRADGTIRPNDVLRYTTTVTNTTADSACLNPVFTVSVPADTEFAGLTVTDPEGNVVSDVAYRLEGDTVVVDSLPALFGGQSYRVALDAKVKPQVVGKSPADLALRSESSATGVWGINPDAFEWDTRINTETGEPVEEVEAFADPTSQEPEGSKDPEPEPPALPDDLIGEGDVIVKVGDLEDPESPDEVAKEIDEQIKKKLEEDPDADHVDIPVVIERPDPDNPGGDPIREEVIVTLPIPDGYRPPAVNPDDRDDHDLVVVPDDVDPRPNGDITTTKTAENVTPGFAVRPNQAVALVGDTVRYTITVANSKPGSAYYDVLVKDPLPAGLAYVPGSAVVTDAAGVEHRDFEADWDASSRTIGFCLGDIYGEQAASVTFECTVIGEALSGEGTLANVATALGTQPSQTVPAPDPDNPTTGPVDIKRDPIPPGPYNPEDHGTTWDDKEKEVIEGIKDIFPDIPDDEEIVIPPSEPATVGDPSPSDPKLVDDEEGPADITLAKTALNLDRDDGSTHVGDTVRYAIVLGNTKEYSMWYDAVIRDEVPEGLEVLDGSMTLVDAAGATHEVPASCYDVKTRVLAVSCGDLPGGASVTLTFEALVTEDALGKDVGNTATAYGTLPSAREPGGMGSAPGGPFVPAEGWPSYVEGRPGVSNPDPVYPSEDVNAAGGILPDDREDGGAATEEKTHRTLLHLAQTGDAARGSLMVVLACTAGCMVIIAMTRMRRRE